MDIRNKISAIYSLEQLSAGSTAIHRLHPLSKLLATFAFIATVVSFGRHDLGRLVPFVFYPAILMALSETPYAMLLKRAAVAVPFCLFVGLSNMALERDIALAIGSVHISFGALSFGVIALRVFLCVTAVLLLAAVTPFAELTVQLRRLKVPVIFILMFEMTYRYIGVLFAEAASMRTAYVLRSAGAKGVDMRHAGSFIGCLLLRSFDRAERVYAAMQCRGYMIAAAQAGAKPFRAADAAYCAAVLSLCLFFRIVDIGAWIAVLAGRVW